MANRSRAWINMKLETAEANVLRFRAMLDDHDRRALTRLREQRSQKGRLYIDCLEKSWAADPAKKAADLAWIRIHAPEVLSLFDDPPPRGAEAGVPSKASLALATRPTTVRTKGIATGPVTVSPALAEKAEAGADEMLPATEAVDATDQASCATGEAAATGLPAMTTEPNSSPIGDASGSLHDDGNTTHVDSIEVTQRNDIAADSIHGGALAVDESAISVTVEASALPRPHVAPSLELAVGGAASGSSTLLSAERPTVDGREQLAVDDDASVRTRDASGSSFERMDTFQDLIDQGNQNA